MNPIVDFAPDLVGYWDASMGISLSEASISAPNAFDNAAWTKVRSSVVANATTGPFGVADADSLVEDNTAASNHYVTQGVTNLVLGVRTEISVYAKAGARTWILLAGDGSSANAWVNLVTGAFGTTTNLIDKSIISVGNGWYHITIIFIPTGAADYYVEIAPSDGVVNYNGDGASNVFLYGAQVNQQRSSAAADQSLASTGAPNAHDIVQATAANQAFYLWNGWNGRPSWRLDGSNDFLKAVGFALNQPSILIVAFVIQTFGSAAVHDILADGNINGSMTIGTIDNASYAISAGSGLVHNTPIASKVGVVTQQTYNGANSEIWYGEQLVKTGNVGANNAGGFTLGALSDGTRSYAVDIQAAMLFNSLSTPWNLGRAKRYLMSKYRMGFQ